MHAVAAKTAPRAKWLMVFIENSLLSLLRYQFHTAVFGAAILGDVGNDRGERAAALSDQARGGNTVLRGQGCDDGVGAALGEIHVRGQRANTIGVADDKEFECG